MGKPDAGVAGIELLCIGQGNAGLFQLFAAQLGFGEQQPAAGVIGQQLHREGGQAGSLIGLAHPQEPRGCLGNTQASPLELHPLGYVDVGHKVGFGRRHLPHPHPEQ